MHQETFIATLTEIRQNVEQLLAQLQASEHDRFAPHLYRPRRNSAQPASAGKSGKPIEQLGRELEVSLATPESITDEFQCRCMR